jgi:hypothetical protein
MGKQMTFGAFQWGKAMGKHGKTNGKTWDTSIWGID